MVSSAFDLFGGGGCGGGGGLIHVCLVRLKRLLKFLQHFAQV